MNVFKGEYILKQELLQRIPEHSIMVHSVASYVSPKRRSRETQKLIFDNSISIFLYVLFMVTVAVGLVVLFTALPRIPDYFMVHVYMVYIMILLVAILLLFSLFVEKIRLSFLGVEITLWSVITLWSLVFATIFSPVKCKCALIALGVTIMLTFVTVVVAFNLPT
nr:unnamed protein product [Trichobilharzia regenti]